MGDLFHDNVPDEWIKQVFNAMHPDILSPSPHTYLILTKRPERMASFFYEHTKNGTLTWNNVWLGVTAENQARVYERIPILLSIPAVKHFVSVEPMLWPVNLKSVYHKSEASRSNPCSPPTYDHRNFLTGYHGTADHHSRSVGVVEKSKIDWVIAGPETGPKKRPCKDEWIEDLHTQSKEAGVPFFDKRKNYLERKTPRV
jgi:protein gp37